MSRASDFGVADLDAFFIGSLVERAFDLEARLCRRRADEFDDGDTIRQRPAAPVLRDMAEQAVLDPVPLRRSRRIMVHAERQVRLIGELLQFDLPQTHARAIRAAAIGRDRQFFHVRIAFAAHAREPRADGLDRELRGITGDADADEASVGRHVVDAVRHDLAQVLVLEVVHGDAQRIALRPIVGAAVPEVADQLFLLRIDGDDGLASCLSGHDFALMGAASSNLSCGTNNFQDLASIW